MKLRLEKGTYRYRTAHKKRQLFFVVLFILAIVAQLILRNFITAQIYKNLVTISAILTVLPMANLASPLVVAARIPEVPEKFHDASFMYFARNLSSRCPASFFSITISLIFYSPTWTDSLITLKHVERFRHPLPL